MVFLWEKSDFDVHVDYFNMHDTFINSLIKSIFFFFLNHVIIKFF